MTFGRHAADQMRRRQQAALTEFHAQRRTTCAAEGSTSSGCLNELQLMLHNMFGDTSAKAFTVGEGDDSVIFVNGILNDPVQAQLSALHLSEVLGQRVTLVHNPTESFAADILQTELVNNLGIPDATTRVLVATIREHLGALDQDQPVTVIGHSQGAAIIASALRFLDPSELDRIDLVTYGGAASEFGNVRRARHVVNPFDIVPILVGINPFLPRVINENEEIEVRLVFSLPDALRSGSPLKRYSRATHSSSVYIGSEPRPRGGDNEEIPE